MTGRRVFGTLLLGVALTVGAPPAFAADQSYREGGCGFRTVGMGGSGTWDGEMHADVVLWSRTHGNVVAATVTCEVRVNATVVASASGSGHGVVAFARPLTFAAGDDDVVSMCTVVDFRSDATPNSVDCGEAVAYQFPPQWVLAYLDYAVGAYSQAGMALDPVACQALRALAPGAGEVTVNDQGDVFVAGEPLWDCPPYDIFGPYPPWEPTTGPSGGGYNDGTVGFLALSTPETTGLPTPTSASTKHLSATCAYVAAPGGVRVTGRASATGADETTVRCRLLSGTAAVYDQTGIAPGSTAGLAGSVASVGGLTVCTEGRARWGTTTRTVGPYCRYAVTP